MLKSYKSASRLIKQMEKEKLTGPYSNLYNQLLKFTAVIYAETSFAVAIVDDVNEFVKGKLQSFGFTEEEIDDVMWDPVFNELQTLLQKAEDIKSFCYISPWQMDKIIDSLHVLIYDNNYNNNVSTIMKYYRDRPCIEPNDVIIHAYLAYKKQLKKYFDIEEKEEE